VDHRADEGFHGVDVAYQAASELALLTGASSFTAHCATAKAHRDLNALLYADRPSRSGTQAGRDPTSQ
jgi:hypothetical protein